MRDVSMCQQCQTPLTVQERGRPRVYCSRSCQARAYRRRKLPPQPPAPNPRRRQVAEALWSIAATRGLEAATMREIAAACGVSLRVVQYHFENKHELLVASLRMLNTENEQRARGRMQGITEPRALLRAILDELLPLDEQRRMSLLVLTAYYARSLTEPALAAEFLHDAQPVEDLVCAVIGDRPNARREADLLVSGITGLGLDVLHGRRSLTDVRRTIDYHLERIF